MWLRYLLKDFFRYMSLVPVSNLQPHMFTYRPVDVTSHLIVSISVLRGHKCCVLLQPYSAVCIYSNLVVSWRSSDDNAYCVLDLGLLLLNSPFLPLGLRYITPGGFLHLLMVIQGQLELSMHCCHLEFLDLHIFKPVLVDSWYWGSSFLLQTFIIIIIIGKQNHKTNDNGWVD
jgi:hypothetical protein